MSEKVNGEWSGKGYNTPSGIRTILATEAKKKKGIERLRRKKREGDHKIK